jgi:hypothetical protein
VGNLLGLIHLKQVVMASAGPNAALTPTGLYSLLSHNILTILLSSRLWPQDVCIDPMIRAFKPKGPDMLPYVKQIAPKKMLAAAPQ